MEKIFYLVAVALIIIWAICFIGMGAGGIIHVLLVMVMVAVVLSLVSGNEL